MQPVFYAGEPFPQPSEQPNPAAVRRLQRDYEKLKREPIDGIEAVPDDANILVWHYVIRGSPDTPYEGGYYYGKILFQPDFPWKPPAICMLTPNGRFMTNSRLCLSISDYHPETWNPGWTVSSILVGLHSFMNEESLATGVINEPLAKRRKYAAESRAWNLACPDFKKFFPSVMEKVEATKTSSASSSRSYSNTNQLTGVSHGLDSNRNNTKMPERNFLGNARERRAQKRLADQSVSVEHQFVMPPQEQCEIVVVSDMSDEE